MRSGIFRQYLGSDTVDIENLFFRTRRLKQLLICKVTKFGDSILFTIRKLSQKNWREEEAINDPL